MADFDIAQTTQEAGGEPVRILRLKGQLDAHTFPTLQDELEKFGAEAKPKVVLDCEELQYVSSAGLGVLKKMTREYRARKGDIRLAALSERINNVVSLLGFSQVIDVFTTADDAVRSYDKNSD